MDGLIHSQRAETFTDYVCYQFSSGRSDSNHWILYDCGLNGKIKTPSGNGAFLGIGIFDWMRGPYLVRSSAHLNCSRKATVNQGVSVRPRR